VRVLVAVEVGVDVATVGVRVAVPWEAGVAVGVGVLLSVGCGVGVLVGVGVEPALTEIVRRPLLFTMSGSASIPITPATTLRVPAVFGEMLIVTLGTPVAGHNTVVAASPLAALAAQPAVEPAASKVTAGWKIAVTVTPDAPPGAETPTFTASGTPTDPDAATEMFARERSYDWASSSAAPPARTAARAALRTDRAPAMRPPFDASTTGIARVFRLLQAESKFGSPFL